MIEIDFIYEVPYFVGLQLFESQNAIEKRVKIVVAEPMIQMRLLKITPKGYFDFGFYRFYYILNGGCYYLLEIVRL